MTFDASESDSRAACSRPSARAAVGWTWSPPIQRSMPISSTRSAAAGQHRLALGCELERAVVVHEALEPRQPVERDLVAHERRLLGAHRAQEGVDAVARAGGHRLEQLALGAAEAVAHVGQLLEQAPSAGAR